MSSLRAFRFQKTKKPASSLSGAEDGNSQDSLDSAGSSASLSNGGGDAATPTQNGHAPSANGVSSPSAFSADTQDESSQESPVFQPASKRPRMISDSDDDGDAGAQATTATKDSDDDDDENGVGMPPDSIVEARLACLVKEFPDKDRMDLQDMLRRSDWDLDVAQSRLRPKPVQNHSSSSNHKRFKGPKKKTVKRHEVDENGGSESDSEGEYNDNNVVYDSDDSEEEGGQVDETMTEDKKRVFNFFNDATDHELACIQGCSKKKVENIKDLRPFVGWGDLIHKIQSSKNLNTEMLNNTTILIRMRDAVARLMEKCEKITRKMETMVERLTAASVANGNGNRPALELTEQPTNIPSHLKLQGYQMIGLNWLVLMHKQSLNGILADEMGLGKTIQAISFLAHLKEMGDEGPHLIIVPSSTMENWQKEITLWCPSLKLLNYYGTQDERRHMRLQIVNEQIEFDLILTTYNMVISSADDRVLFRKLDFHYVIFDEAHMLKNMGTARYENLMRVRASRKLLLTGTPLQNNLVELMSLLVFVMPEMFANKKEQLKKMFSLFPKSQDDTKRSNYELDRIAHAKRIMKPFFLRRLKSEVLTELPKKTEEVMKVAMSDVQHEHYHGLVATYRERAKKIASGKLRVKNSSDSGVGLLMNLRKAANHPLLNRKHYDDAQLKVLARLLKRHDPGHREAVEKYIVEDLAVMSDFYIHKTCLNYRCIEQYSLGNHALVNSGKFGVLDRLLPDLKDNDDRVLLFTQFTMVLDIMEQYLKIRGHRYLRLDGQTPVQERQMLIDQFNRDDDIFLFILSTKAGGLGINLTSANTVILHDLDFNPYNDKQAEDRCHRVGQTRAVKVIRMISEDTIEEGIYSIAQEKLKLEQDLTASGEEDAAGAKKASKRDLKRLLKTALDVELPENTLGDVGKVYTEL